MLKATTRFEDAAMTITAPPQVEFEHPAAWEDLTRARADRVRFVYVSYRRYFMLEGGARPGSPEFQAAISTLYPVGYTLHFALKARGVNAPIGMLEGLYWCERPGPIALEAFAPGADPLEMSWRLLLATPDEATDEEVSAAIAEVARRGTAPAESLAQLRCQGWLEGESAQILHVGSYDAEYPTEARLHEALAEAGLRPRGCHHEIYLSQPSTPPERTRTIIRQPVEEIAW
jgi:hypothetical protein